MKKKDPYRDMFYSGQTDTNKQRQRASQHDDIEKKLSAWFTDMRASNVPINGPILKTKAEELAGDQAVCGESQAVDDTTVDDWRNTVLADLLRKFSPSDIYNADETGLFWRLLPDKTMEFKGTSSCHGGKQAKERVTVLCCANMDGSEKWPLFVIGKFKQPRCFKGLRRLPVSCDANKKAGFSAVADPPIAPSAGRSDEIVSSEIEPLLSRLYSEDIVEASDFVSVDEDVMTDPLLTQTVLNEEPSDDAEQDDLGPALPDVNFEMVTSSLQSISAYSMQRLREAAWIPGHVDIFGNDVADQLAKEGGMMEQIQHNPSYNEAKTLIISALDCHWRQEHPQHNSKDAIHKLSRAEQVTIFRLRTGHNRLKHHLFSRFRIGDGSNCPCGANRQDTQHVLQDCPLLDDARLKYWPEPREMNQKLYGSALQLGITAEFIHLCLRPHLRHPLFDHSYPRARLKSRKSFRTVESVQPDQAASHRLELWNTWDNTTHEDI
ncbi:tigger transposable element-derived protein 4 [Elysia marginata]|uniref:Tigger transposable element-derived protein 4 n=1 Tax=Elysia marginata TaxID=1093978 RepID=A0AAV4FNX9_9GAST|nr:tigger transposable element-derived protein 4 [Elysia marginata]